VWQDRPGLPRMRSLLTALRPNAIAVLERLVPLLEGRPRLAYVGGHGVQNLGDDALFEAAQRVLDGCHVATFRYPRRESRLARLGLSGPRYFRHFILGGGTFINDYGLPVVRTALQQGLSAWTLGTGVGSAGFNMRRRPDLTEWRALLRDFRAVGVRGPLSKATLDALGVPHAEVVGDLALMLARQAPLPPVLPRRFAVNITLPPPQEREGYPYERLEGLERAIRHFVAREWTPVFVSMHVNDDAPLRRLMAAVGRSEEPLHHPTTAEEYLELVGPCTLTLATRLHAAVLSCCAGTPALSLGYREKCLDFMASLGLEAWHVDLAVPEDDIFTRALELAEQADGLRATVLARAQERQRGLREYVRKLLAP
jgi:polysaccharide pyruvyl transferase WcaK-like protein